MRFKRLAFPAFGPFTDFKVELDPKAGLHLFYGPNESGKSSALRAVRGLLYGIPSDGRDEFKHAGDNLLLEAVLVRSTGDCLSFSRRKGRGKKILRDEQNQPMDADRLKPFLGSVGEQLFDRLYGLDHRTLSEGGKALLAEGGDMGESLFAAGLGPSYRRVRDSLQKEAEELWKERSRNLAIDRVIKDFHDATDDAFNKSASVDAYRRLKESVEVENKRISNLEAKIHELKTERQKWKRYQEAHSLILERSRLLDGLEKVRHLPRLDSDFSARRQQIDSKISDLEVQRDKLIKERDYLGHSLKEVPASFELLGYCERINGLSRNLGRVVAARLRLPVLKLDLDNLSKQISNILVELNLAGEEFLASLPTAEQCSKARDLAGQYALLSEKMGVLEEECLWLEGEHERVSKSLAQLGEAKDLVQADIKLTKLRQGLKLDSEIASLSDALSDRQAKLALQLSQLALGPGGLEALCSCSVPSVETIRKFKQDFESLEGRLQQLDRDLSAVKGRGEKARAVFQNLDQEQRAGSREELTAERERREQLWQAFLSGEGLNRKLQSDFERSQRRVDELTDLLLDHAAWVAQREQARLDLEENRLEWTTLSDKRKKISESARNLSQQWSELWRLEGLTLGTPQDMLDWVSKRAAVLEISAAEKELSDRLTSAKSGRFQLLKMQCEEWEDSVGDLGPDSLVDDTIKLVELVLAPLREVEARRRREQDGLQSLEKDLHKKRQSKIYLQGQLSAWAGEWSVMLKALPGEGNTEPFQLEAVLQKYDELRRLSDRRSDLGSELDRVESEISSFCTEVAALKMDLGEPEDGEDELATVERLSAACTELSRQQAIRQQLLENKSKREIEAIDIEQQLGQFRAKRRALMEQVGKDLEVSALIELEQKNIERYDLESRLNVREEALLPLLGGQDIEEFAREIVSFDWDKLPGSVSECQLKLEELEEERDLAHQKKGELVQQLRGIEGDEAAAQAAQVAAEVMAEGKDLVLRYANLAIARAVLTREMDRYRRENEAPMLSSASKWFSILTQGVYRGLAAGVDPKDDRPRLEATTASGLQVPVDGLSDGTRDQLYLALRLAAIGQAVESIEPVPMVLDDVLVHFDGARAKATLEALAEFSARCQILLFSHLERDRRLALELGSSQIQVIDLEPIYR